MPAEGPPRWPKVEEACWSRPVRPAKEPDPEGVPKRGGSEDLHTDNIRMGLMMRCASSNRHNQAALTAFLKAVLL